jgi:hypothetical protein
MAKKQQKRKKSTRRIADKQGMVSCPMKDEKVNTNDACDKCDHEMNRQGRIVNCDYMEDEEEE